MTREAPRIVPPPPATKPTPNGCGRPDKGLVIRELPLEDIEADAMVRDRMSLNAEEMDELQASIAAHGLRLPVEVFEFAVAGQGGAGQNGARYGLLSGYRRLRAVQSLAA